jgi:hypothetical protein
MPKTSSTPLSATDRRSFLKTGALVATPVVALAAPAAAFAGDESRAQLARLEDERAIERLQRAFLRRFNGAPEADCGEFLARSGAVQLDASVRAIAEHPAHEPVVAFAEDGRTATLACACRVELEQAFEGQTTLERMTRFQGHGRHRHSEERTLKSEFARTSDGGWVITRLALA